MSSSITPLCDGESGRSGAMCCLAAGHPGDHAHVFTWANEPEPTPQPPKWRQMVDATKGTVRDPLAFVLQRLAEIEREKRVQQNLAYIIAVCEQQVGDGWQAAPWKDMIEPPNAYQLAALFTAHDPAVRLAYPIPPPYQWIDLGNAAAAWLALSTGESS